MCVCVCGVCMYVCVYVWYVRDQALRGRSSSSAPLLLQAGPGTEMKTEETEEVQTEEVQTEVAFTEQGG